MKVLLQNIKNKIHFLGIGGIGMCGIAEVLHSLGYEVQGSDIVNNYLMLKINLFHLTFYLKVKFFLFY